MDLKEIAGTCYFCRLRATAVDKDCLSSCYLTRLIWWTDDDDAVMIAKLSIYSTFIQFCHYYTEIHQEKKRIIHICTRCTLNTNEIKSLLYEGEH